MSISSVHVCRSEWNWNLFGICLPMELLDLRVLRNLAVLVFEERGKLEYPEKNLSEQGENQQQTQPTYDAESGNRTWATLVVGKHSHHCTSPVPETYKFSIKNEIIMAI